MKFKKYFLVTFLVLFSVFPNCFSTDDNIEQLDIEVASFINDVILPYFYDPSIGLYFIKATITDFIESDDELKRKIGSRLEKIFGFVLDHMKYEVDSKKNLMSLVILRFKIHIMPYSKYEFVCSDFPKSSQAVMNLFEHMQSATNKILRGEPVGSLPAETLSII